jgi:hypothetical protein
LANKPFHGDDDASARVGGGNVERSEHARAACAENQDVATYFVDWQEGHAYW